MTQQAEEMEMAQQGKHYEVPERIRSIVYLIGMLGFPVVVASYVLVVLSNDLKLVDKSLNQLASRIDERPMSLDKTTDFVIYVTDALKSDLKASLPELMEGVDLTSRAEAREIVKDVNKLKRQVESYVRPIVRRHQRFAERFPSAGGNLGASFKLHAPAEDIEEGDTEGYLTGETAKDFGESLVALISNNLAQFGHPLVKEAASEQIPKELQALVGLLSGMGSIEEQDADSITLDGEDFEILSEDEFLELTNGAIDTAVTAMRDQILLNVKLSISELERDSG